MPTQETPETIGAWTRATFGDNAAPAAIAARANEEMAEFLRAVIAGNLQDSAQEAADVWIVLCHFAAVAGVDLQAAIDRKMEINRARRWEMRGDGTGQHV